MTLTTFPTPTTFAPPPTTFLVQPRATTDWPNGVNTPYVYRPTCDPHTLASLCGASPSSYLCLNTLGNTWSSCQPQQSSYLGYVDGDSEHTTWVGSEYYRAVCPEGWWALNVGLHGTTKGIWIYNQKSTATCCKSGDSLGKDVEKVYDTDPTKGLYKTVCVNTWEGSTRMVKDKEGDGEGTVPMTEGTVYYPGWTISWRSTDTRTLTPVWPSLTSDMLIPTWTPGMQIKDGQYDNKGPTNDVTEPREDEKKTWGEDIPSIAWKGIVIGAVLGFFGLVALLWCCCWCVGSCFEGAKKRKERRRATRIPPFGQRLKEKLRMGRKVGDAGEGGAAVRVTEVRQDVPEAAENKGWRWNSSGGKGKTAAERTEVRVRGDIGDAQDAAAKQTADEAELARRFEVLRRQMTEGKKGVEDREVRTPMPTYQRESERERIPIPAS